MLGHDLFIHIDGSIHRLRLWECSDWDRCSRMVIARTLNTEEFSTREQEVTDEAKGKSILLSLVSRWLVEEPPIDRLIDFCLVPSPWRAPPPVALVALGRRSKRHKAVSRCRCRSLAGFPPPSEPPAFDPSSVAGAKTCVGRHRTYGARKHER